ncbi:MAG TPA: oligopeptide:H+ symporter [Thermoanaerobaculia bacterium]|jgi:POT family proton-dependent oligopeptide transporter
MTQANWLGHPRGLSVLFFTEMWERFSYYGMRSLLILFMVAPAGLALSTRQAAMIYGAYTMGVYGMSIPGGWLADRVIGHYRAVLAGGVLIMLGHFSMAVPTTTSFFAGLVLIVFGTGLLKPNVSTMVGFLYSAEDERRDSGFSLFYMGINLGAMIAPLVCGFLGQRVNWHLGFAVAGVGMALGLTQYMLGRKHLPETERRTVVRDTTPLTSDDWRRLFLIGVFFVFALVFFAAFEQSGSTLTLFADRHTRTSIFGWSFPSSWFQSEQPLFVIAFAPVFAALWLRVRIGGPLKFAIGLFLVALGFLVLVPAARAAEAHGVRVSPLWLTLLYLLHTFGELCLSPVGLSLVTKLSPKGLVGLMMGVWFLAAALGNFIAGWIAGFAGEVPLHRIFTIVAVVVLAASVFLLMMLKPIRRVAAVAAAAMLVCTTLFAQVGFQEWKRYDYTRAYWMPRDLDGKPRAVESARPMHIFVWYPAQPSSAPRMTVGDYVALEERAAIFSLPFLRPMTSEQRAKFEALPALAQRDAPPAAGKFPLILYSLGSPATSHGTPEFLAAHGYVVVQMPRLGVAAGMPPDAPGDLDTKVRDTEFLLQAASGFPPADVHDAGAIGFSAGGRWALSMAMKTPAVRAVVSLDSVMLFGDDRRKEWQALPYFDLDAVRVPVLHLVRADFAKQEDLKMWEALRYAERTRVVLDDPALEHFDFQSGGYESTLAGLRPQQATLVAKTYEDINRRMLEFLDAHLKNDAGKRAGPPTLADITNAIAEDSLRTLPPDAPEAPVNLAAYTVLFGGEPLKAIRIFQMNVDAHPQSANTYDSLGDAYAAAGDAAKAEEMARTSLSLLKESDSAALRANIARKLPVAAMFDRLQDAALDGDVATLETLYAPDYVHTNANGSVMTRADVLDAYRKHGPSTRARHEDDAWQLDGDKATLTTRIAPFRVIYRFEKRGGAWLAVESRATMP